jgi:hypothetical protein
MESWKEPVVVVRIHLSHPNQSLNSVGRGMAPPNKAQPVDSRSLYHAEDSFRLGWKMMEISAFHV